MEISESNYLKTICKCVMSLASRKHLELIKITFNFEIIMFFHVE